MLKKRIVFVVLMIFPLYCATLELKNREFTVENNQEFVSTDTTIGKGKVVSTTACASLCTSDDECCTANYNESTQACHLNSCCFPDTRPSENGIIIKKVAKPNKDDIKNKPIDCGDLCQGSRDGIYRIFPNGTNEGIDVYCELEDGWTVIQRRVDDSEDFNRNWSDYKHGFGNVAGNFWLGNENIHQIVARTNYTLRVDMESLRTSDKRYNVSAFAVYQTFNISDESSNYTLTIFNYSGNWSDGMDFSNNMEFSTFDSPTSAVCVDGYKGGLWYDSPTVCSCANLNGLYSQLYWTEVGYKLFMYLKHVSMKIKRS